MYVVWYIIVPNGLRQLHLVGGKESNQFSTVHRGYVEYPQLTFFSRIWSTHFRSLLN